MKFQVFPLIFLSFQLQLLLLLQLPLLLLLLRSLLLEDCDQDMKEDVRHALMRNLLFAYAQLAVAPDWKQYGEFRQRVRSQLQAERKNFYLLSVRNRILAEMICRAPWSFHVAYRIFAALFQREEQH